MDKNLDSNQKTTTSNLHMSSAQLDDHNLVNEYELYQNVLDSK